MKVLHFLNFQLIPVLELQCATRTGIPRCYRHWGFKVLHVFELQGAGKKEVTIKEKKKKMMIKNKLKRSKEVGVDAVSYTHLTLPTMAVV